MADFSGTLAGVVVGGSIVLAGQALEHWRVTHQWRADRKAENLAELQDDMVELRRAATQASEKRHEPTWHPARYEGARLRVRGMSARVKDTELKASVDAFIVATDSVARQGEPDSRMDEPGNRAIDRTAELLANLK